MLATGTTREFPHERWFGEKATRKFAERDLRATHRNDLDSIGSLQHELSLIRAEQFPCDIRHALTHRNRERDAAADVPFHQFGWAHEVELEVLLKHCGRVVVEIDKRNGGRINPSCDISERELADTLWNRHLANDLHHAVTRNSPHVVGSAVALLLHELLRIESGGIRRGVHGQ